MEIMGSIQGEGVVISERERMQRLMRDFIAILQRQVPGGLSEVAYKVHFGRPAFGAKVDSLIEFRMGNQDVWCARANGADSWRSFCRALGSLKQIMIEMEIRGDGANAKRSTSI